MRRGEEGLYRRAALSSLLADGCGRHGWKRRVRRGAGTVAVLQAMQRECRLRERKRHLLNGDRRRRRRLLRRRYAGVRRVLHGLERYAVRRLRDDAVQRGGAVMETCARWAAVIVLLALAALVYLLGSQGIGCVA